MYFNNILYIRVPYYRKKRNLLSIERKYSSNHMRTGLYMRMYKMHITWRTQQSQRIGYHCVVTVNCYYIIRIITIRVCNYVSMENGVPRTYMYI